MWTQSNLESETYWTQLKTNLEITMKGEKCPMNVLFFHSSLKGPYKERENGVSKFMNSIFPNSVSECLSQQKAEGF